MLAVLIRNAPAEAVDLLNKDTTAGKLDGMFLYETGQVYRQISQPFPDEILMWLRTQLKSGTDQHASLAAHALSIGGIASDGELVEQRLSCLRAQWLGKEPTNDARQAEVNLASVLGAFGSKTFLEEAQRRQLGTT